MNYIKISGWTIFLIGLAVIAWTLLFSYNIFTAKTAVPEMFKMAAGKASLQKEGVIQDIQAQLETMMSEQLKGILPADSIPKLLNLVAWSIGAFILIFGGTQISSLGIKLMKN